MPEKSTHGGAGRGQGRHALPPGQKKIAKLIDLLPDMWSDFDYLADLGDVSRNSLIRSVLHSFIQERFTEMKKTTQVADIVAIADQIYDGQTIVTAHMGGRSVRVNAIMDGPNGVSCRVSHRDWPEAQYFDVEDGIEFQVYTQAQYAAMLDAIREK